MEGAFDKADKKEMEGGMAFAYDDELLLISVAIVCVEWLKSCARVNRWRKEVSLVRAEMECSLISLEHHAKEWEL